MIRNKVSHWHWATRTCFAVAIKIYRECLRRSGSGSGRDNPISDSPDGLMVAWRQSREAQGMTAPSLHDEPAGEILPTKPFEPGGLGQTAVSSSSAAAAMPPRQLRASFSLWLMAVAAGLFETILVVIDAAAGEVGSAAEVAVGVTARLLAFTGLLYLAVRLRQGRNWARIALA